MKLNFIKVNPTENMTVYILDTLPIERHGDIAKKILSYSNLHGEQVGYIEAPCIAHAEAHVRLQMMGGEFCGNAARGLAAVLVARDYPGIRQQKGVYHVLLDVSGAAETIPCQVKQESSNHYIVTALMPYHKSVCDLHFSYDHEIYHGTLVEYLGISHVVFFTNKTAVTNGFIKVLKQNLPNDTDALGIMLFNEQEGFLTPIVHVAKSNTQIMERGCGSGSAAVVTVLAHRNMESLALDIQQPGGCLNVAVNLTDGKLDRVALRGPIEIIAEGQVNI